MRLASKPSLRRAKWPLHTDICEICGYFFMTEQPQRLISLDVFRGITIAGMVLVNNPGSWANIYWPLGHAQWHGWTPTDLVFPFFLFIVGVAIPLALGKRVERGDELKPIVLKIVFRTVIIFLLGEFLAGFPILSAFHDSDTRCIATHRGLLFLRVDHLPDDAPAHDCDHRRGAGRRLLPADEARALERVLRR